jgi:hypothetical protein
MNISLENLIDLGIYFVSCNITHDNVSDTTSTSMMDVFSSLHLHNTYVLTFIYCVMRLYTLYVIDL